MGDLASLSIVVDRWMPDDAKPIAMGKDGRALFFANGKPVWPEDVDAELMPYVVGYLMSQKMYDDLKEYIKLQGQAQP